jgi:hypothetical protein
MKLEISPRFVFLLFCVWLQILKKEFFLHSPPVVAPALLFLN